MMKRRDIALGAIFVIILWVPSLYMLENSGTDHFGLRFWLRVLIGGYPMADAGHPETSGQFAFADTLALLLRLGPLVVLFEIMALIMRGAREQGMNVAQPDDRLR